MTRTELEKELALIGWRIEKSWNGLNDYIINYKGEKTSFVIRDNYLEIRTNLFGGKTSMSNGSIHFELANLSVSSGNTVENGKVDWVSINFSKKNFIQFFNHE